MAPEISIKNKLYLKQVALMKMRNPCEVLPLTYNYQDLVIVETGLVEEVVFQTHSCGCGPQPAIKGGFLERTICWRDSAMKEALTKSGKDKESSLAGQDIVTDVHVVRKANSAVDQAQITTILQKYFGTDKKISFF